MLTTLITSRTCDYHQLLFLRRDAKVGLSPGQHKGLVSIRVCHEKYYHIRISLNSTVLAGYARLAQACVSGEYGAAENYLIDEKISLQHLCLQLKFK